MVGMGEKKMKKVGGREGRKEMSDRLGGEASMNVTFALGTTSPRAGPARYTLFITFLSSPSSVLPSLPFVLQQSYKIGEAKKQ